MNDDDRYRFVRDLILESRQYRSKGCFDVDDLHSKIRLAVVRRCAVEAYRRLDFLDDLYLMVEDGLLTKVGPHEFCANSVSRRLLSIPWRRATVEAIFETDNSVGEV